MSNKVSKQSKYEKQVRALRQKARHRAALLKLMLVTVIAVSLISCYALVLNPTQKYEEAQKELTAGNWSKAREAFSALGSFKSSRRQAAYAGCMELFDKGDVSAAADAYNALGDNDKLRVQTALGSFAERAESAMEAGAYREAYLYYSLDLDNPERDDTMYAITVYLDSEQLLSDNKYTEARAEISACLEVTHALSAPLQTLMDDSFEREFDYYDSFTRSDLAFAVEGMEGLRDEYEPAHIYLRDLYSAYYGGVLSMEAGKYQDAINQFEDIVAYSDCALRIDECRVLLANQQAAAGDEQKALETLKLVSDWQDYLDVLPEDNSLGALIAAGATDGDANNA